MKYLQFTLRDFFWLTIVVGLTVGIVIERNQVRALRVYQGKAQWWEEAAKRFAEEVEKQTGIKADFQEGAGSSSSGAIAMRNIGGSLATPWPISVNVRSTEDKSYSWPTGMYDLNMVLIFGPIVLIGSLIESIRGGERKRQAQALLYAKMRPYAWVWAIGAFVSVMFASVCYLGGPFCATMLLLNGALCALNYWRCKQSPPVPVEPATA
jgi:hypothetical protein